MPIQTSVLQTNNKNLILAPEKEVRQKGKFAFIRLHFHLIT